MRERSLEVMPDRHRPTWQRTSLFLMATTILLFACANQALAHAVAEGDKGYIQEISGVNLIPFMGASKNLSTSVIGKIALS